MVGNWTQFDSSQLWAGARPDPWWQTSVLISIFDCFLDDRKRHKWLMRQNGAKMGPLTFKLNNMLFLYSIRGLRILPFHNGIWYWCKCFQVMKKMETHTQPKPANPRSFSFPPTKDCGLWVAKIQNAWTWGTTRLPCPCDLFLFQLASLFGCPVSGINGRKLNHKLWQTDME